LLQASDGKGFHLTVNAQPPAGSYYRGRLILTTNYAQKPEIIIPVMARILHSVEVMPMSLDFGLCMKSHYEKPPQTATTRMRDWRENLRRLSKSIYLRINRGADVHLSDTALAHSLFRTDTEVLRSGHLYRVTVTPLIEQMPPGEQRSILRIRTDHPAYATFEVPVRITVK
jgi:hypothetical protein